MEYGFWAFLVVAIGRVGELIGLSTFPLGKIALVLPIIIRVLRRKRLPGLATEARPLARTATWLLIIAVLLTPLSAWPGESRAYLVQLYPVLLAVVSIAYVMCRSWSFVRRTLLALIVSGLVLARAALSGYSGGRAATATMYDPNDLAYLLVTLLPLVVGFVTVSRTLGRRLLYAGIGAILLIALLLTQSRGGLLGLMASLMFMIFVPIRAPEEAIGNEPKRRTTRIALLLGVSGVACWVPAWRAAQVDPSITLRAE